MAYSFIIRFLERKKKSDSSQSSKEVQAKKTVWKGEKKTLFSKKTQPLFTFFPGIHKRRSYNLRLQDSQQNQAEQTKKTEYVRLVKMVFLPSLISSSYMTAKW